MPQEHPDSIKTGSNIQSLDAVHEVREISPMRDSSVKNEYTVILRRRKEIVLGGTSS